MPSNRGDQEATLHHKFDDAGGHVDICAEEWPVSVQADADGATQVPDIIRWVLEHKGINITNSDVEVGPATVNNWQIVLGNKVPYPNTFFGYAGWLPARTQQGGSPSSGEIRFRLTTTSGETYDVSLRQIIFGK